MARAVKQKDGFSWLEVVVILAILSFVMTLALPALRQFGGSLRLTLAAAELTGVLRTARSYAIRNNLNVAVKFYTSDDGRRVSFALFGDGDGDGVRNRDLGSGVDPQIQPPRDLSHLGADVYFGFPRGIVPRAPGRSGRRLDRLHDPIRFNRSDLASFSPLGGATPGTVYLTDGYHLAAVRVFDRTGKVSVLRFDRRRGRWD